VATDLRERLQSTLGNAYTIERELGGGGMSRVFVADETAFGRKVVVKVLPPDLAAGVSVDRFKREIQVAARLQHPVTRRSRAHWTRRRPRCGSATSRRALWPRSTARSRSIHSTHSRRSSARTIGS